MTPRRKSNGVILSRHGSCPAMAACLSAVEAAKRHHDTGLCELAAQPIIQRRQDEEVMMYFCWARFPLQQAKLVQFAVDHANRPAKRPGLQTAHSSFPMFLLQTIRPMESCRTAWKHVLLVLEFSCFRQLRNDCQCPRFKNAPWEARTPDLEVNSLTL